MIVNYANRMAKLIRDKTRRFRKNRRRRAIAMAHYSDQLAMINAWSWLDTETSNFYYDLTAVNRVHLAHAISSATGADHEKILCYFNELDGDQELREHLERVLKGSSYGREIQINYGRRLGWYAFVRVLKPKIVVETGVDHGVGSCVLASALLRNAAEGSTGRYFGTELRPDAGQLFTGKYAEIGSIIYGDSIESLEKFAEPIDIFINDSDHSAEYELNEYVTISEILSDDAIILGDNSHVTDSLSRFSRENGRRFMFFSEKPKAHWYPGAGIGISYR